MYIYYIGTGKNNMKPRKNLIQKMMRTCNVQTQSHCVLVIYTFMFYIFSHITEMHADIKILPSKYDCVLCVKHTSFLGWTQGEQFQS